MRHIRRLVGGYRYVAMVRGCCCRGCIAFVESPRCSEAREVVAAAECWAPSGLIVICWGRRTRVLCFCAI